MDPELELLTRIKNSSSLVAQQLRLRSHSKPVTHVALKRDSNTLYSSSEDNTVKAWNLSTGRCSQTFAGHESPINASTLDGSQRLLFTASNDSTARGWDSARGRELIKFEGHGDSVTHLLEDNGKVYTASNDKTARVWDVNTGAEINLFRGHTGSVRSLTLGEGILYTASWDSVVIAWDARTGQELARYPHPDGVLSLAVLDDMLFSACWDGNARVFDIRAGDELVTMEHPSGVVSLALDRDMLFTACWDGIARAWEPRSGTQLLEFAEPSDSKKTAKNLKKAGSGTTKSTALKSLVVDDGKLFVAKGNVVHSWCWEREPLILAAAAKDITLLTELLDAGAVVDARGAVRERTALMHAAITDTPEAAKALLRAGADIDAEDSLLKTPVDYAAEHSRACAKAILDQVTAPMAMWDTPLCKLLLTSIGSVQPQNRVLVHAVPTLNAIGSSRAAL